MPTLGWPANGISALGVKMRTSAVCAGSLGGSTKVVSARLNSAAIACICAVVEALRIGDDGQRVAAELAVGEDVDGGEFEFHGADPSGSPRMA